MTGCQVDSLAAAAEAADALHARGARNVIITLGAKGALLSEQGVKSPIPCFLLIPAIPPARAMPSTARWRRGWPAANRCIPRPDLRRPMPPSASKSRARHPYLTTKRHENGFCVPPLIMKWHKPYCIKTIKRIAQ